MNNKPINQKARLFCTSKLNLGFCNKIPIAMRITLLFMFLLAFHVQANQSNSQVTKVSLDMENSSIEEKETPVILSPQHSDDGELVFATLDHADYSFSKMLQQQKRTITGTVIDPDGLPVIGANIIEVGTTNGTITDMDGNFSLNVGANATIRITYIGYLEQNIRTEGRSTFNVALEEDTRALEEIIVVGYGTQKKESVVGAISTLSSDDILRSPSANISQAMSGTISGLFTSQISGSPGSDDVSIFIRGRATFASDSQPLVLVDGVERPFSQIAPDDIESISVLKDASATAVYGVRGANGVLLITTKRGRDEKPVVSLTANWQFQSPTREDTYLNSYESVKLLEEALANDGLPSQYSANDIEMYRKASEGQLSGVDRLLYPDVDWHDEVLDKVAPAQRYNLSIRGGTKRMRYYASGEMYQQASMIKNLSQDMYGNSSSPSFNRSAFRVNTDFFMTKDLTMSINFGTRFEGRFGPNAMDSPRLSEIFYEINHTPSWIFPVYYPGVKQGDEVINLYGGSSQYQNNIVARLAKGGHFKERTAIIESNYILNYDMGWLTEGLSTRGMVSFDYQNMHRNNFRADFATYELNDRANHTSFDAYNRFNSDTQLSHSSGFQAIQKLYIELQLNYARTFGVHEVTGMLLYNQNDLRNRNQLAQRYQGLVGRATYAYAGRYLFDINAGYNGSENFQRGSQRFGFFPSFALGWRITEEEFMESAKSWLDNLKLRVSYGQVGNDKYRQRFLYEERWLQNSNTYYFGTTPTIGIYETQYPNYNVTWETANKYNFGLEFGLLQKLTGNIEFFYEDRNDILTEYLTQPQWVGVVMAAGNLGKTQNKGIELELKFNERLSNGFNYNAGLMFSHSRNKILEMDEPELKTDYRKREGHPIDQFFGLVVDGFVTQADLDSGKLPTSSFGVVNVGDFKYRDVNGDNIIDERDETFIGYSDIPENMLALTLGGGYKNWSFNIMFQGVSHVSRFYDAEAMFAFVDGGKVKKIHLDRWDPSKSEADNLANAKYPLLHYDAYANHNQRLNSFFLKNGAFARLKNVEVSYRLPTDWSEKVGMSECRLYVNGNNLLTWDHLNGLTDPESNGSNRYPIMKTVNFGVNIRF